MPVRHTTTREKSHTEWRSIDDTNATKPATLETGAEIKVPLFIDRGERIKVDTRTGEYLSRA